MSKKAKTKEDILYEPNIQVTNWDEDAWTHHLISCLKLSFPDYIILHTTQEGLKFEQLQADLTNGLSFVQAFIFHGAPDIIVDKNKVIEVVGLDSTDTVAVSDIDAAIENYHQRNPLKSASGYESSEKLGELIASLHFLLVWKRSQNKKR